MNPRQMTDQELIQSTEALVTRERELLTSLLRHLREIERRRLFCDLGHSSLFAYTTERLGYSGDQAMRRINAMRLLKDLPEVEAKMAAGEVSLSNAAAAQSYFRREARASTPITTEKKRELIAQLANKSYRQGEQIIAAIAPRDTPHDRVRVMSPDTIELRFAAPSHLQDGLNRLKGWLAHKHPHMSLGELFEKLVKLGLEEWDPSKPTSNRRRKPAREPDDAKADVGAAGAEAGAAPTTPDCRDASRGGTRVQKLVTMGARHHTRLRRDSDQNKREPLGAPQVKRHKSPLDRVRHWQNANGRPGSSQSQFILHFEDFSASRPEADSQDSRANGRFRPLSCSHPESS